MTPQEALAELLAGNERFAADRIRAPHRDPGRRVRLRREQRPFAAVSGCADSRVPPELLFDRGLGDLFVVRVAGHCLDRAVLASLQFAAVQLEVPLVLVLAHSGCGAVRAALEGGEAPGELGRLIEAIEPAIERARGREGPLLDNAIRAHARGAARRLRADGLLAPRIAAGSLAVETGFYDLETGRVEIIS